VAASIGGANVEIVPLYAAPPLSSEPQADLRALVQSIISDGYLSETNVARAHAALNAAAVGPLAEKGEPNVG
jgi:hypothetical protein